LTLISTSIAATPDKANKEADATITFTVKANGGDIYMNHIDEETTAKEAIAYAVTDLGDESLTYYYSSSDATLTGSGDNSYYTIPSGQTRTFTIVIHIISGNAGFYKANITNVR